VSPARPSAYAGFVTRAVALTVDALLVDVIAIIVGAAVTLIATALGGDSSLSALQAVIGGFAWLLWSAGYFVTFWTLTGQTPGQRLLGIRVASAGGGPLKPMRAIRRFVGLVVSMIPLGAGFLPVLVDDKRRGLHDRIAGTVVHWDVRRVTLPELSPAITAPSLAPPPADPSDSPASGIGEVGPTVLG
jgi:uncharacterized RDD family membrane protein YckC